VWKKTPSDIRRGSSSNRLFARSCSKAHDKNSNKFNLTSYSMIRQHFVRMSATGSKCACRNASPTWAFTYLEKFTVF
jgi:hypothetical protein